MAAEIPSARTVVTDLRGTGGAPPPSILADPSGRRARNLRRTGTVIGLLLILWLLCLVLAGLGLLPARGIPLAGSVRAQQPRSLATIPPPRPPSKADLKPARPVGARTSQTPSATGTSSTSPKPGARTGGKHGRTPTATIRPARKVSHAAPIAPAVAPASGVTPSAVTAPGHQAKTAHGHSGSAPGAVQHTSTTIKSNGNSTTTTSPSKSGSAPGQTRTNTTGHGPPG
jgi:hypothetical protein